MLIGTKILQVVLNGGDSTQGNVLLWDKTKTKYSPVCDDYWTR